MKHKSVHACFLHEFKEANLLLCIWLCSDTNIVDIITILLTCINMVWLMISQTGCGDGFCSGHRMHTTLNKHRVCRNNVDSYFYLRILCEILVVKSAPELNFLMRNGVPKLGVDPGLKLLALVIMGIMGYLITHPNIYR